MRIQFRLAAALLSLSFAAGVAVAQDVPSVIRYQARLTDNSPGQVPVDDTLSMDFRIYGSSTGSDLLWSESWPAVAVTGGLVNVLLGSNGSPLDVAIFSAPGDRYLEIEIDGEILAPRQRMGAVAYAQLAASAADVAIACDEGQVLKFSGGSWECSDPTACPVGSTTDCYTGPAGTLDVGVCSVGAATCNGAGYGDCIGEITPTGEVCNGDDDNCDGATDETFPEMNTPCTEGVGACEASGFVECVAGSLGCDAVPGTPQPETCNGDDDDCNGTPDDGLPPDSFEPNDGCGATAFLGVLGSDQIQTFPTPTVYPSGDADYYRINLNETDGDCGCGFPFTDEDYRFHATLTVPPGAGSYQVCIAADACGSFSCLTVPAGTSNSLFINLDGDCSGTPDSYTGYVRVQGLGGPGFDCEPYTLQLRFESGLCF